MFNSQKIVFSELVETISLLNPKKVIGLSGKPGIGKTYVVDTFIQMIKSNYSCPVCYIKGDQFCQDRDYYCIKQALSKITLGYEKQKNIGDILTHSVQDIPYIGSVSAKLVSDKVNKKDIQQHERGFIWENDEELEIIYRLNYIFDKRSSLIVCDNIQYFDSKSLELIYLLVSQMQDNFLKESQILFIYTEIGEQKHPIIDYLFSKKVAKIIDMFPIDYEDMECVLKAFGCNIDLDAKIKKILYNLSDGHLEIIKHIVSQMNQPSYNASIITDNGNAKEILEKLINDKLKSLGANGEQISELLEYASLIGMTFSNEELSKIVELNSQEFYNAIKKSNDLALITSEKKYSNFSHDIIQLLFRNRADKKKIFYYEHMKECIKELYPSQYARRIDIERNLGNWREASILIALFCAKQNYDLEFKDENYKQILQENKDIEEFLYNMNSAFEEYNKKNYKTAINIMNTIEDILPIELQAERDLLKSISLTKLIDESYRLEAIRCLENYTLHTLNNEGDLYLRVQLSLISSYSHVAEIDKAKACEKDIFRYLEPRLVYDENARTVINILRRKSNSMHECLLAERSIKKSVQYFSPLPGQSAPLDPIQYLMSLGNYAGILIECGCFKEACRVIMEAQELVINNQQITFPRTHIIDNNYLISTYLMDNSAHKEVLCTYEKLVNTSQNADNIFILSNYSALLAINGDIDKACDLLEKLKNSQQNNSERFYELCIYNNLLIIQLFKQEYTYAQNLLNQMKSHINGIIDESYYQKRFQLFQEVIDEKIVISFEKMDTFLYELCEYYQEAWAYWGRSFDYTALYYWSDM